MTLCNSNCKPCCDFCIYCIHETFNEKDKNNNWHQITGSPIGCNKYNDRKHNHIARMCGFCEDFHCKNVKDKK
jgi:hypothetical protein